VFLDTGAVDNPAMRIHEHAVTTATPTRAWELIADPSLHGRWNSHIVETQATSSGSAGVGYRYRVTYELSGRRSEFDAVITEFAAPSRYSAQLEERLKGDGSNFQRFMVETYVLTRRRGKTNVDHEVLIHHPGINPFLRGLIWLIMKIGRPVGQPMLAKFAELAEGAAAGAVAAARSPGPGPVGSRS